jgi:hypothetical protein
MPMVSGFKYIAETSKRYFLLFHFRQTYLSDAARDAEYKEQSQSN